MVLTSLSLVRRLKVLPLVGIVMGAVWSIRALIVGGIIVASRTSTNLPILLLAAVYPAAGAVGGVLAALTFPLVRWVGGAFVVGALAMLPLYLGVAVLMDRTAGTTDLLLAAGCATAVGGIVGTRVWLEKHRNPNQLAHVWLFALICAAVAGEIGSRWAGEWPAVIAIFLFLVPISLALMVTLDDRDRRRAA